MEQGLLGVLLDGLLLTCRGWALWPIQIRYPEGRGSGVEKKPADPGGRAGAVGW